LSSLVAGQFDGQGDHHTPPAYVEKAFRKYLECGIFAHGFARVRCDDCGDDFLVAFSCKGRAICPSCNTRRMAEAAAHLMDHVFPRLPVRQWVLLKYPSVCAITCSATKAHSMRHCVFS
jgi:ribosomal protein S27E